MEHIGAGALYGLDRRIVGGISVVKGCGDKECDRADLFKVYEHDRSQLHHSDFYCCGERQANQCLVSRKTTIHLNALGEFGKTLFSVEFRGHV